MTLNAAEVRVAGTGALYKAPLGEAEPANSTAVLAANFEHLGYVSSDGVEMSFEDSVNNTFAWQNSALVRTSRTETLTKMTFTFLQTRGSVLEAFHSGSEITEPATGEYRLPIAPAVADPSTWIFDAIDGGIHMRYYIPNGEITERGSLMHVNGEPIGYPMTMTFYPDSSGNLAYLLSNDAAMAEGVTIA